MDFKRTFACFKEMPLYLQPKLKKGWVVQSVRMLALGGFHPMNKEIKKIRVTTLDW